MRRLASCPTPGAFGSFFDNESGAGARPPGALIGDSGASGHGPRSTGESINLIGSISRQLDSISDPLLMGLVMEF